MNTQELAIELVRLCRAGEMKKAVDTLYSKEIVSVEPMAMPTMPAEMRGLEAVKGKTDWWMANHETHSAKVQGPFINGDRFVVHFEFDVTEKKTKKRMQLSEVGVYTASNGKVVREEFFFLAQPSK